MHLIALALSYIKLIRTYIKALSYIKLIRTYIKLIRTYDGKAELVIIFFLKRIGRRELVIIFGL